VELFFLLFIPSGPNRRPSRPEKEGEANPPSSVFGVILAVDGIDKMDS